VFNARVEVSFASLTTNLTLMCAAEVLEHAKAICNITHSNSDLGYFFNASVMLGFVGSYFCDSEDRDRQIEFMGRFSKGTN